MLVEEMKGGTKMTRKQALLRSAELLESLPETEEITNLVEILKECADDLPVTKWDAKTIFDTIEQYYIDNGRYPNAKEFESRGLPSHGMTVIDFLDTFYPDRKEIARRCNRKYSNEPKEHWLKVFQDQMMQHSIRTGADYNKRRTEGPGWAYIAHLFGLKRWKQLIEYADVAIPPRSCSCAPLSVACTTNTPDINDLKKIRSELQKQLLQKSAV